MVRVWVACRSGTPTQYPSVLVFRAEGYGISAYLVTLKGWCCHVIKEFKEFIARGSMLDLAVGLVLGVAFGKIITSLVKDVIMPPIGLLLGKVDFSNLYVDLSGKGYPSFDAAKAAGAPTLAYGLFINTVIEFLIVALAIFLLVKGVNRLRKAEAPTTKDCPKCLSKIPVAATKCAFCTSDV